MRKSANARPWAIHSEAPMQVRAAVLERCRREIEPAWKRLARRILRNWKIRRLKLHAAGEGFHWGRNAMVRGAWIGNFASFGHSAEFFGPVVIGDLSMLSTSVQIIGQDHVFTDPDQPMRLNFPQTPRPVTVIEADCWIGSRVTIIEGVRIGRGSVIGTGALVTRPVPPYSIVTGIPARVVRRRFDQREAERHDLLLYGRSFPEAGNV